VDLTTGTAAMVNAGHPHPLRLRDGRVEVIELAADPPFGIVPGIGYRVQPVELLPGDRIVFLTDGVLERNAATADIVGVVAATRALHPRELVQEINSIVLRAVDGKLRDDATALCLDWYGGGERDRNAHAGANRQGASPPRADSR
jgi:serine phosphatase RsbU (regulator of sigma subunit)